MVRLEKLVPGLTEAALQRFLNRARRAVGLHGAVDLLVTSNAAMKSLNRRFRGKNQATDVLSFPAGSRDGCAGDIAISAEIAARSGRLLGHTTAQEVKILVLHGVLHLRGYDHEHDNGRMARREAKLRRELGLPLGLIARSAGSVSPCARRRP